MNSKVDYFEVWNEEDLLEGFKSKKDYMIIKGDYNHEVRNLLNTKLSDNELLGLELGSAGLIYVFSELIYKFINSLNNKEKEKKELESAIRQYNFKIIEDDNILLYSRTFDY